MPRVARRPFGATVAALAFVAAGIAAGVLFSMDDTASTLVRDSLVRDRFAEFAQILVCGAGLFAVGVSYWESRAPGGEDAPRGLTDDRERVIEYYTLLLSAVGGMAFFVQADTLMTLFLGLEWFSIALYVLTAIGVHRLASLEAGLKYLIVGSFGSAILLFGSALVYGATGELEFGAIAAASGDADQLFLVDRARDAHRRARLQDLGRAVPHVDAGRLPGRADAGDRVHVGGDEGRGARRDRPPARSSRSRRGRAALDDRARGDRLRSRSRGGTSPPSSRRTSSGCSRTRASRTPASCSSRSRRRTRSAAARSSTTSSRTRRSRSAPSRSSRRGSGSSART